MNDLYAVMSSPFYQQIMLMFSLVTAFLALAIVVVGFSFYGRASDARGASSEKQRWTLLMGTWRDALIITLLFVSDRLLYHAGIFQAATGSFPTSVLLYAPTILPVLSMCLHVAIFVVAILRIILISRWLAAQDDA